MAQVSAIVRAGHADVGFVHDADGERIGIVDDRGRRLSEEYTLVLAAGAALARRRGPIVTNVCTTGLVDRVAQAHGVAVFRTPVGQPNISAAILEHGATIGGEGNGSVAVPEVQVSHDAAATMTLLLEHLARTGEPVSSQVDRLPALSMVKQVVPVDPRHIYSTLQAYRHRIAEAPGTARRRDRRRTARLVRRLGARARVRHGIDGARDRGSVHANARPGPRGLGSRAAGSVRACRRQCEPFPRSRFRFPASAAWSASPLRRRCSPGSRRHLAPAWDPAASSSAGTPARPARWCGRR